MYIRDYISALPVNCTIVKEHVYSPGTDVHIASVVNYKYPQRTSISLERLKISLAARIESNCPPYF
jgi:hypothetical protein